MLKERAFILEDIHADSIREIEILISDSCRLGVKRTYSDQPMEAISDQQRHAKGTGAKGAIGHSHPSNSAHPRQKTRLCVLTAKSRAHGSISVAVAGLSDSNNASNLGLHIYVKR